LKAVLQTGLKNLDLVTREEFEVQRGVLGRTRQRLEQLQERLDELEKGLSQKG
jgi:BMFP domain-containing protein YqiC